MEAAFDTLAYAERLKAAGIDGAHANAHAEALRAALGEGVATRADVREIRADIARLGGRIDGIEGRIDGIEGRIDGLEGRIDGIEEKMATKTDLAHVEEKMATKTDLAHVEEKMATKTDLVRLETLIERSANRTLLATTGLMVAIGGLIVAALKFL